jgi:hypothetical protein
MAAQSDVHVTTHLSEDSIAELRKLRAELAAIRAAPVMRHGWLKFAIKDLETNPKTQYKVHYYGAIYWIINFPLVMVLFFGFPLEWLKWGVFITLMYSLYANFATDYGAMSAALAAQGQAPLPEIPSSTHVEAESDGEQ